MPGLQLAPTWHVWLSLSLDHRDLSHVLWPVCSAHVLRPTRPDRRRGAAHWHCGGDHARQPHAGHHCGGRAAGVPGRSVGPYACLHPCVSLSLFCLHKWLVGLLRLLASLPCASSDRMDMQLITGTRIENYALKMTAKCVLCGCRRGGDVQRGGGHDRAERPRAHPCEELQGALLLPGGGLHQLEVGLQFFVGLRVLLIEQAARRTPSTWRWTPPTGGGATIFCWVARVVD